MNPWIIHENKWRATRFGLDAEIIIDENGNLNRIKNIIIETIEKLSVTAKELQCDTELNALGGIVENNSAPYIRQIKEFKKNNKFRDIVQLFIEELADNSELVC